MTVAVVLSLIATLFLPGGVLRERDCNILCLDPEEARDNGLPRRFLPPPPGPAPEWTPGPSGPSGPPPTECVPYDPSPPEPDVIAMPVPDTAIVHEAGDGEVVVGMETEFRWEGPREIRWTQPEEPGVREDCSLVPGGEHEFTATLHSLIFEFEEGERNYVTNTGRVKHTYNQTGRWTVCVYAAYEIPGGGFSTVVRVAELDHDVVEIRSTLDE